MELELPTDVLRLIANYNSRILRLFELVNRSLNTWAKSFRVPASQATKDLLSQFPIYHTDDQSWDGYTSSVDCSLSTEFVSLPYRIESDAHAQTVPLSKVFEYIDRYSQSKQFDGELLNILICAGRYPPPDDTKSNWAEFGPEAKIICTLKSWYHDQKKMFGNSMDEYGVLFIFAPLHPAVVAAHSLSPGTGICTECPKTTRYSRVKIGRLEPPSIGFAIESLAYKLAPSITGERIRSKRTDTSAGAQIWRAFHHLKRDICNISSIIDSTMDLTYQNGEKFVRVGSARARGLWSDPGMLNSALRAFFSLPIVLYCKILQIAIEC